MWNCKLMEIVVQIKGSTAVCSHLALYNIYDRENLRGVKMLRM